MLIWNYTKKAGRGKFKNSIFIELKYYYVYMVIEKREQIPILIFLFLLSFDKLTILMKDMQKVWNTGTK